MEIILKILQYIKLPHKFCLDNPVKCHSQLWIKAVLIASDNVCTVLAQELEDVLPVLGQERLAEFHRLSKGLPVGVNLDDARLQIVHTVNLSKEICVLQSEYDIHSMLDVGQQMFDFFKANQQVRHILRSKADDMTKLLLLPSI